MPTLRLILIRFIPALSSTQRGYGRKYGTNGSWGDKYSPSASRANRSQVRGGPGPAPGAGLGGGGGGGGSAARNGTGRPGITYQRSYAVHYHDAETSSQVHLHDLDSKGLEARSNVSECSA